MKRVAARLLRLALEQPEFARVLIAELQTRPEFRKHVENKRFRNPETNNKVLYDSLPEKEQRRLYLEWWRAQKRTEKTPSEKQLNEKRQRVEKSNPWAIPLWEYYDRVQEGAGKKWHAPGEIKTQTVESLSWRGPPGDKRVQIGEREFGDDTVTFYRSVEPRKYVKRDENGDIARDSETGLALYLDEDEMVKRGLSMFEPTLSAYVGNTPIGSVADEWGATLVQVAEEYQKKGIGQFLSKLWRKAFPFKGSGGFSDQGLSTFKRVYQDFVREALDSGQYDKAIKEGWMSPLRFIEILDSAGLDPQGKPVRQPTVKKPAQISSKMQKLIDQMADAARIAWPYPQTPAQNDQEAQERADAAKRYQMLQDQAAELQEEEEFGREDRSKKRGQKMSELADAYWKAQQQGNAEEAKRIWDQMGSL